MDALAMEFADNTFDLVWACESGEHMPDKKAYVEEMARVLAPGGQVSSSRGALTWGTAP
jgi:MPBQ/MSBQ methyltransferase